MRALLLSISLLLCVSCKNTQEKDPIFIEKSKPTIQFNGSLELRFLKSSSINYTLSTISKAVSLPSLSNVAIDSTHRHILAIRINPSSKSSRMKRKMKELPIEEKPQLSQREKLTLIHQKLQTLYPISQWEIDSTRNFRDSTKYTLTGRLVLSSSEPFWEGSIYKFISQLEELSLRKDETEYHIGELAYINRDYRNRRERRYQEGDYVVTAAIKSSDIYKDIALLKRQLKTIPNSYYITLKDEAGVEFQR